MFTAMSPGLGEYTATDYAQWTANVRAAGMVVTRMPYGPNAGQIATRSQTTDGWLYQLAPQQVRDWDNANAAAEQLTAADRAILAVGEGVQVGVNFVTVTVPKAAGEATRNVIGGLLGLPPWVIGAIIIGGLLYAGKGYVDAYTPRHR